MHIKIPRSQMRQICNLLFVCGSLLMGCDSAEKTKYSDTANASDELLQCPRGTYPALLQVWSSTEENNVADTPPLCEAAFNIELQDDGSIYSTGDCEIESGQQSRVLSYEFQGQQAETNSYTGEVTLTKRNGEQELAPFSGTCTKTETSGTMNIEWSMTVTTPYGERQHNGVLASE